VGPKAAADLAQLLLAEDAHTLAAVQAGKTGKCTSRPPCPPSSGTLRAL
jgi:hypothetical protein